MPSRADIVAQARTYIGVPWRHQGRTRQGVDCAGVVILVAHDLGLSEFDVQNYTRNTVGHSFLRYFREHMDERRMSDVRPGDVVLFRDSKFACHSVIVGELNGELSMIHAYALRRKVVEEPMNYGDWMQRRIAAFSFKGLTD